MEWNGKREIEVFSFFFCGAYPCVLEFVCTALGAWRLTSCSMLVGIKYISFITRSSSEFLFTGA
jgi:hypothetical protein